SPCHPQVRLTSSQLGGPEPVGAVYQVENSCPVWALMPLGETKTPIAAQITATINRFLVAYLVASPTVAPKVSTSARLLPVANTKVMPKGSGNKSCVDVPAGPDSSCGAENIGSSRTA